MAALAEPSTHQPERRDIASRLLVPEFWASLTIAAMWLAVLFDGVFGGDMVFTNPPENHDDTVGDHRGDLRRHRDVGRGQARLRPGPGRDRVVTG
jgi:hypothetical protein